MIRKIYSRDADAVERFGAIVEENPGLLIGLSNTGIGHCVAWDGFDVYDPNGAIYPIDQFMIETFWMLTEQVGKIKTHILLRD